MDYFGLNLSMLGSLMIFLGVKRLVQVQTVPFKGLNRSKMGWGVRPIVTDWTIMLTLLVATILMDKIIVSFFCITFGGFSVCNVINQAS